MYIKNKRSTTRVTKGISIVKSGTKLNGTVDVNTMPYINFASLRHCSIALRLYLNSEYLRAAKQNEYGIIMQ